MSQLIPNYTDADFLTLKDRLRTLLAKTDTFKDYNFEGANITILMELMAYVGDLNTYFTNKLAQNIHTETANVYEVVHSLVRQQGHEPAGYVSPELTMTIRVNRENPDTQVLYYYINDQIYIPAWFTIDTVLKTSDGTPITYCTTQPYTYTVVDSDVETRQTGGVYLEFDIVVRQGEPEEIMEYTGEDIVSGQIVLPFKNYDQGTYPYDQEDTVPAVSVEVNDIVWTRVSDFYDEISGIAQEDQVYMLSYDKYKRYVLKFSDVRTVPDIDATITVQLIKSLGSNGAIRRNVFGESNKPESAFIEETEVPFLRNITRQIGGTNTVPVAQYVVSNTNPSTAGALPQMVEELKVSGEAAGHSQQRNCTKYDYIGNLEARGDVTKANAWGEQEQNPNTLITTNYNRAYVSLIPSDWVTDSDVSVQRDSFEITGEFVDGLEEQTLEYPVSYNSAWTAQILEYLEPRKMLGIWEEFILPEVVYFRVDFGLKVKRGYDWFQVRNTIVNKLSYYFESTNRNFGEVIDFREIYNYIMDLSNASETDSFDLIRGVNSLVIRDVMINRNTDNLSLIGNETHCELMGGTWTTECSIVPDEMYVYPDNIVGYYPHYINTGYAQNGVDAVYNVLTPIQLGHNQFPMLAVDYCKFVNEG